MVPRYAIVDVKEREEFEKRWHLPYGYFNCFVTTNFDEALERFRNRDFQRCYLNIGDENFVIEKVDENGREVVYRYE